MQQTNIDRWLRKKFLFITSMYTNTLPDELPSGLDITEAGEETGARYRYKLTTRNEQVIEEAAECFRMQNITYTSRVSDRKVWFSKCLTNRQKSVTFQGIWLLITIGVVAFILSGIPVMVWQSLVAEEVEEGQEEEEVSKAREPESDVKVTTIDANTALAIDSRQ